MLPLLRVPDIPNLANASSIAGKVHDTDHFIFGPQQKRQSAINLNRFNI
jgi:hypothetical protein